MKLRDFLESKHVSFEVLEHEATYDAQHLAHALHVPGCQVAKSVLLRANHGYRCVVAVVPATRHVDLQAVSRALGQADVQLAQEPEVLETCPEAGPLTPFGAQYGTKTLLDTALLAHESIVFEGDSHEEAIKMTVSDFCNLAYPIVAPLSKETTPEHSRA